MVCKKCGNELKDGELFCEKCGASVETNKREKKIGKKYIILSISVILVVIITIVSICLFIGNSKKNKEITQDEQITNGNTEVEASEEKDNNNNVKNYIEIEMPNLIGKSYMDIIYNYTLKEDILDQLYTKDLEGTTYNMNTLKYIADGSINLGGYYIIEGYGYEVENQKPEAGTKIKIMNDGEGNVTLGEDIELYIKGGGSKKKIEVDKDNRSNSNTEQDTNTNQFTNTKPTNNDEVTYIHTAEKGCILLNPKNTSESVRYKYKCDYCGSVGNYEYSCYPLSHDGKYEASYVCQSCKKNNTLVITTVKK